VQYGTDAARVWVALAVTATTPPTRIAYLERALDLDGVDVDRIRAEISWRPFRRHSSTPGRIASAPDASLAPAVHRAETWWVRAPMKADQLSPVFDEVLDALEELKTSLARGATLLKDFDSVSLRAALLNAAATATVSVGDGVRRQASGLALQGHQCPDHLACHRRHAGRTPQLPVQRR
jgi:hypothetical protein